MEEPREINPEGERPEPSNEEEIEEITTEGVGEPPREEENEEEAEEPDEEGGSSSPPEEASGPPLDEETIKNLGTPKQTEIIKNYPTQKTEEKYKVPFIEKQNGNLIMQGPDSEPDKDGMTKHH